MTPKRFTDEQKDILLKNPNTAYVSDSVIKFTQEFKVKLVEAVNQGVPVRRFIQEAGYDGWGDGHSGNSGGMAVRFAYDMLHTPELFPYEHGAMSYLVGDEGYHDDRSDVHEAVEAYKAKKKSE